MDDEVKDLLEQADRSVAQMIVFYVICKARIPPSTMSRITPAIFVEAFNLIFGDSLKMNFGEIQNALLSRELNRADDPLDLEDLCETLWPVIDAGGKEAIARAMVKMLQAGMGDFRVATKVIERAIDFPALSRLAIAEATKRTKTAGEEACLRRMLCIVPIERVP